ncbi:LysR family transcriptional regulator [Telmatospirillum sp.]|uniref:LysR family transcriptional regulator n=1 Tax=Telmatospirillum sp. TaxID=2079197 RepID=UPI0028496EAE|nr:LysR family transcriptional regulator [Telmatospirillum sp.]MDR3436221.1 LysR family transcriptional regulator [Telmatospirillum sp.]
MDWSDVKIFLAIARNGTLGAAARAAGQSQPTMGRRLRALEAAVGHTLFQRTSDGFVLTDEGTAALLHAERMEEEALSFERELAGQGKQLAGVLRVASSDWFGVHVLTPILARLTAEHPRLTIELLTDARIYSLARREADLAFRIAPFDESGVIQRKLAHLDYGLYGATGTPPPEPGSGLGAQLVTMDHGFASFPDAVWMRETFPRASVAFRSNSRDAQAQAVLSGAGIAVLPRLLADRLPGLVRFEVVPPLPGRDVWVGYHSDLRRLRRLRVVLEAILSAF